MTLADDIARWASGWNVAVPDVLVEQIVDGLEREKVIIDRDSLPDVIETRYGALNAGGTVVPGTTPQREVWDAVHEYLAIALHLQSRETAEARLQERREKVAREIAEATPGILPTPYRDLSDSMQTAIDRIIDLAEKLESS